MQPAARDSPTLDFFKDIFQIIRPQFQNRFNVFTRIWSVVNTNINMFKFAFRFTFSVVEKHQRYFLSFTIVVLSFIGFTRTGVRVIITLKMFVRQNPTDLQYIINYNVMLVATV